MHEQLTHFSLFSGIGGLDLAAEAAGFETLGFCEQNEFCRQILGLRWPGVPVFNDIFTLTNETLGRFGIRPGTVRLLTGGFPCQPFSHAGQRLGTADDRYLWPEMLRVIGLLRPTWVVGENVAGILSMDIPFDVPDVAAGPSETVLAGIRRDLKAIGYDSRVFVFPACAVGAPHRRDRVFIVAHDDGRTSIPFGKDGNQTGATTSFVSGSKIMAYAEGRENNGRERGNLAQPASTGEGFNAASCSGGETLADPSCRDVHRNGTTWDRWAESTDGRQDAANPERQSLAFGPGPGRQRALAATAGSDWWAIEPGVGRVAHGVPHRVDRLKALGNAVVWQQAYTIIKPIAHYETEVRGRK